MINPDAMQEAFSENALDIDLNRDAVSQIRQRRKSSKMHGRLQPELAFNLHDQADLLTMYTNTPKQADYFAFLAPAYK